MAKIRENLMIRYAVSCKLLKTGLTYDEYCDKYIDIFDHWCNHHRIQFDYLFEEYDKHEILHIHGVIKIPKEKRILDLLRPGYNVCIKRLRNSYKWLLYASKSGTNEVFLQSPQLMPCPEYTPKLSRRIIPKEDINSLKDIQINADLIDFNKYINSLKDNHGEAIES